MICENMHGDNLKQQQHAVTKGLQSDIINSLVSCDILLQTAEEKTDCIPELYIYTPVAM